MHVLTDSIAAFVLFIHFVRSRELNATVIAFVLFSTRFKQQPSLGIGYTDI